MLADRAPGRDEELPDTGVGIAWERRLSPALITGEDYGTRASTILRIAADGEAGFEERTLDAAGAVTSVAAWRFRLER